MAFPLPKLKYTYAALAPHISADTVKYHYGKHTKKYFDTVNDLIKGTAFEKVETLEELITRDNLLKMDTALFNNACQAWNHQFYWSCLTPPALSSEPSDELHKQITSDFGSLAAFKKEFADKAVKCFGSGWTWLSWRDNKLSIKTTPNAENPLKDPRTTPLLVIDVWEHGYYLDYQNDRAAYVDEFWNIVNWDFVNERFEQTK